MRARVLAGEGRWHWRSCALARRAGGQILELRKCPIDRNATHDRCRTISDFRGWLERVYLTEMNRTTVPPPPTPGRETGQSLPVEVRVENLYKSFGSHRVLNGINLVVYCGEMIAIVGGSGNGKTTLLRQIIGLEHPDQGHVFLADHETEGSPLVELAKLNADGMERIQRHWAVVFQGNALISGRTVEANIALPLREVQDLDESTPKLIRTATIRITKLIPIVGHPVFGIPSLNASARSEKCLVGCAKWNSFNLALHLISGRLAGQDEEIRAPGLGRVSLSVPRRLTNAIRGGCRGLRSRWGQYASSCNCARRNSSASGVISWWMHDKQKQEQNTPRSSAG
jgi:ABC transporter